MVENATHRKLTAILCADVKGYSKLMGEDESYTVVVLKVCRQLFAENIHNHGGRVVNAPGDSILAEFPSVVSAVQCAVEIQNQLNTRNAELDDNRKMVFRIGINLGDVIQSEDAIYGDGVNIAARIEALAEPGGVSISRTVFNQVRNKLTYGYEYQGEHQVKNINNPVKVFKLLTAPEDAGKLVGMEPTVSASKWIWPTVVVAAVIVALIGYHVYQEIAGPKIELASVERMAFALPEKPSVAVLPIDNMSGDPQQEYICDGLSEQIITSLSKVSGLFVIARNSSFSFKGKAVKVQEVAEQLGVRYVLEGSLQKSGHKVRITAQLIDAITGHHLWAETYDRELKDIFALQDEITIKILGAVGAEFTTGERARIYAKGTDNLEAYVKVSKGYEHFERQGREENILARQFAKEAIDLDPNYPSALSLLGGTYLMDPFAGSTNSAKESWDNAVIAFQKALALDETHAPSHGGLAMIFGFQRKYEKALSQAQRGIALNPGFPIMHTGYVLVFVGRYEEAVQYLKKAIRHDPKSPTFYYLGLGHAYRGLEQYENAIAAYNEALERDPDYFMAHVFLTATYYLAGREEEARAEAADVLRLQPKFSVARLAKILPYQDKDFLNRTLESMRKAGLPDNPRQQESEKPSIAVLPFENMSGDPDQQYFSDGIAEQIITSISKVPYITVIARQSSFVFRNSEKTVQQIAEELGVKYILEGSLQRSGNQLRINIQLIDAASGHHIWADHYDREINDIFAVQDEICKNVMVALQVKLTAGEAARLAAKTTDIKAYEKFLKGMVKYHSWTDESLLIARQLFIEAIDLDPRYAIAYVMVAWIHLDDVWRGRAKTPSESIAKAEALAQQAISIHGVTTDENALLTGVNVLKRDYDRALAYGERAVEQCPNCAGAQQLLGYALRYKGHYDAAIFRIKKAIQLEPVKNIIYLSNLAWCYLYSGQHEQAIATWNEILHHSPDNLYAYLGLTAAYWWSGSENQAREAASQVLRIKPQFSTSYYEKLAVLQDEELRQKLFNAWRLVGLK